MKIQHFEHLPRKILGIGIESSCDDTGVALVANGTNILANPKFDQTQLHEQFGGVVPEIAGRAHLEKAPLLLKEVLDRLADLAQSDDQQAPDYIAVTMKPGLAGSLFVGYYTALALAKATGAELIPIHHLEAHLYAVALEGANVSPPFLGFLASGGNTALYKIKGPGKIEVLGDTFDDAAGEAYDKAASLLGLGYPGGPAMEKLAAEYIRENPGPHKKSHNPLPYILKDQGDSLHFSFSGLKTALYYLLQKEPGKHSAAKLAWCFQERIFEIIERNLENAIKQNPVRQVVAAGGVLANRTLKERLKILCNRLDVEFFSPSPALCTDNAAMVAAAGYLYYQNPKLRRYEEKISPKNPFL